MIGTYTTDSTPGIDGAPVAFGITAIVFLLSVANKRNK
jgi:translation elongation factor EF-1beta